MLDAITDTCEVVDKILYRSSRLVTLNATDYHNEDAGFASPYLLCVADGISHCNAGSGDLASGLVVRTLRQWWAETA